MSETVGDRIAQAIDEAGFSSQSEFARKLEKKPSAVNRWINNPDRGIDDASLRLIADATGKSVAWLRYGNVARETGSVIGSEMESSDEIAGRVLAMTPDLASRLVGKAQGRLNKLATLHAIEEAYAKQGLPLPDWLDEIRRDINASP